MITHLRITIRRSQSPQFLFDAASVFPPRKTMSPAGDVVATEGENSTVAERRSQLTTTFLRFYVPRQSKVTSCEL